MPAETPRREVGRGPGRHDPAAARQWLDDFFDAYYAARPVNATFIGVHEHDHRLPDLSDSGAGDAVAAIRDLLERARRGHSMADAPAAERPVHRDATAGPRGPAEAVIASASDLPWHVDVDLRLARGYLRTQLWELESPHFRRSNPCVFTGEAVFGVLSLFLTDFAPFAERAESAASRLAAIPAFLDAGRRVIGRAPRAWTERAIRECDGASAFLADGLPRLLDGPLRERHGAVARPTTVGTSGRATGASAGDAPPVAWRASARDRLGRAARDAAAAVMRFRDWLAGELPSLPAAPVACGDEALDLYIRQGHFLDSAAVEIERYAVEQMREAASYLSAHAGDFGAASPDEALRGLASLHPPVDRYYARYDEILAETRALARAHDLLTWPDSPIRFVPRPDWAREAAPHLYFLFYRSPAAYGRPPVHDYLVEPIEPLPVEEQERLLRATNDSVIRLNHVIHHGGLGHHVQNWHAFRSPSRIGRVAAVDCASRIAMFCGGSMAEGWACYATELMAEHGALSPLEGYAEIRSRVRMCARAIVDVRLHEGRFSLADAARFYEEHAGMAASAAHAEAVKNSMFPGAALMYLVGADRIRELRREVAASEGDRFRLRRFHDTFLSFGSIPVSMISALMTGRPLPGGVI